MKKRLLLAILAFLLLLPLPSCAAKERYELLYSIELDGVTYCVRGSGTRAKQVVVKRGEEIVWAKTEKAAKKIGSQNGTYGFQAADFNFDGYVDLALATEIEGNVLYSTCWLYNPEKQTYEKSKELSSLGNLRADHELEAIFSFAESVSITKAPSPDFPSITVSTDSVTKRVWEDGVLVPKTRVSMIYYSETDRYCYRVEYYNAAAAAFEIDQEKWLTKDEYLEIDWSFLYYFK
ncbi:MAG: hypothetical protein IKC31_00570 [Clostridia bacterium]|nr:hypothetical protein [Clostridia bacterium]